MFIFPVFKTDLKMPNISPISIYHHLPGWKKSQTPLSISLLLRWTDALISIAKCCMLLKMNSEIYFLSVSLPEKTANTSKSALYIKFTQTTLEVSLSKTNIYNISSSNKLKHGISNYRLNHVAPPLNRSYSRLTYMPVLWKHPFEVVESLVNN